MSDVRFVPAILKIIFEEVSTKKEQFLKEFTSLSEYEEDSVGQWLKLAKAKGETDESDQVLLTLIVELHKKMDQLTSIIKDEGRELLVLKDEGEIAEIGFEHIKLSETLFKEGEEYYARIFMPTFPRREMPLFLKATTSNIAKIIKIHDQDEKDWSSYMTARERVLIRQMRGDRDV